jgi:anti-sigma factor RsiW
VTNRIELDDTLLMAYLDGELDAAEVSEVEAAVATRPAVEARLRDLALGDAMLRATLRTRIAQTGANEGTDGAIALPSSVVQFPRRRWQTPTSLAAGFVLMIAGGALGYALRTAPPDMLAPVSTQASAASDSLRHAAFQSGLEHEISGQAQTWRNPDTGLSGGIVPVRTWQTREGRFCREFEEWYGNSKSASESAAREGGVACRDGGGQWKVRMRYYPG